MLEVKYFGITIDMELTFSQHCQFLQTKVEAVRVRLYSLFDRTSAFTNQLTLSDAAHHDPYLGGLER